MHYTRRSNERWGASDMTEATRRRKLNAIDRFAGRRFPTFSKREEPKRYKEVADSVGKHTVLSAVKSLFQMSGETTLDRGCTG